MTETWTQERPAWCPHADCRFRRQTQGLVCGGELPEPVPHDGVDNTHRLCLDGAADDGGVLDLQVNANDLAHFRFVFDALDGKRTSWLSRRT